MEIEAADDATGKVKTVAGEGVWSVDAGNPGAIIFTPEADYAGAVTPIAYTDRRQRRAALGAGRGQRDDHARGGANG